jgi:hypothetical protein
MRKIIIFSVVALFICAIAAAGCTSKQPQPVDYTNLTHNATTAKTVVATVTPTPSLTPSPTPTTNPTTVTGSFDQSSYVFANGTVITAHVSNWQSNPSVVIGTTAHVQTEPMQSLGNGQYTLTWEGVIMLVYGSGHGGITLVDNGKVIASATTTWTNQATLTINGPTMMTDGGGGTWVVYIDGQLPTLTQATQIQWSGAPSGEKNMPDTRMMGPVGSYSMDANGAANTAPGAYTLTATYMGSSTSFSVTRLPNPTPAPPAPEPITNHTK